MSGGHQIKINSAMVPTFRRYVLFVWGAASIELSGTPYGEEYNHVDGEGIGKGSVAEGGVDVAYRDVSLGGVDWPPGSVRVRATG